VFVLSPEATADAVARLGDLRRLGANRRGGGVFDPNDRELSAVQYARLGYPLHCSHFDGNCEGGDVARGSVLPDVVSHPVAGFQLNGVLGLAEVYKRKALASHDSTACCSCTSLVRRYGLC
jgi:hypothetical protein